MTSDFGQRVSATLVAAALTGLTVWGAPARNQADKKPTLAIVANDKATARIVLCATPSWRIQEAAALLARTIHESTGVSLPTVTGTGPAAPGIVSIHCGSTDYTTGLDLDEP